MTDPAARLRRVRDLFDAVIELPAAEQAGRLSELAGGDEALVREVMELLDLSEAAPSLILSPAMALDGVAADSASLVDRQLGPYRIVRLIGTGGMGAVYQAERSDDQFQKRVAIKVMQQGITSSTAIARFRRERQILASFEHPNIATLLDGGLMPDGRPYLVMEYVEGAPITSWSNRRSLSIRERIGLFRQVCAAVQQAHRALIIHRDLKPANILVTEQGRVKLLDFGIATFVAGAEPNESPLTRGGARAFTPEYASPEQIRGQPLTTASDLYSLGVVFFELLTGRRPHQVESAALVDIERAVLDTPIPRPSTVITDRTAAEVGERSTERLRGRLKGELDNVALAALQPIPDRRYPSVEAFDDDLRRYLEGMPVRAQPDWVGYRIGKFAQRNLVAVAASVLVVVALLGGAIATTVQAHRARVEQGKEAQIDRFLRGLLSSMQPAVGRRDVAMSEVLDSASRRLSHELADQPDVRGDLEAVIGQSYVALGRYDDAEPHMKSALALERSATGDQSDAAVARLCELGELYMENGAYDSATAAFKAGIAARPGHKPDSLYAALLNDLGTTALSGGQLADAERYHRQALAVQQKVLDPSSDIVAETISNISTTVGEEGRVAEADSLARLSLSIVRKNHPDLSIPVANGYGALAAALDMEGKNLAADSAYRETLRLQKALLGPEHPDYVAELSTWSAFILAQHRYQEAADASREILALRGRTLAESNPSVAAALQTLGLALDKLGDPSGAERALTESLELRRHAYAPGSWLIASSEGILGDHYATVRQFARAEALMLDAQAILLKALGPGNPRTITNEKRLMTLYGAWQRPHDAARYRALIESAATSH